MKVNLNINQPYFTSDKRQTNPQNKDFDSVINIAITRTRKKIKEGNKNPAQLFPIPDSLENEGFILVEKTAGNKNKDEMELSVGVENCNAGRAAAVKLAKGSKGEIEKYMLENSDTIKTAVQDCVDTMNSIAAITGYSH